MKAVAYESPREWHCSECQDKANRDPQFNEGNNLIILLKCPAFKTSVSLMCFPNYICNISAQTDEF